MVSKNIIKNIRESWKPPAKFYLLESHNNWSILIKMSSSEFMRLIRITPKAIFVLPFCLFFCLFPSIRNKIITEQLFRPDPLFLLRAANSLAAGGSFPAKSIFEKNNFLDSEKARFTLENKHLLTNHFFWFSSVNFKTFRRLSNGKIAKSDTSTSTSVRPLQGVNPQQKLAESRLHDLYDNVLRVLRICRYFVLRLF